jgi:hypothetical protein
MVARCTQVEAFGSHGNQWQCELADPHPDRGHLFPVDATHYGLRLEERSAPWLASELRMAHRKIEFEQGRVEEATRVALNLAAALAGTIPMDDHRLDEARAWLAKRAPVTRDQLVGIAWSA